MMRVICLLIVSLFALKVNAQQYTKFNGYGFQADRLKSDSVSIHPSDTIRNKAARSIAVLNGVFYIADGTKWKVVGTDTTALSNRINLKLNISDTSSMLSNYSRLKSVGLTMPSAFSVANSPLTSNGTLAVTGAGISSQYVRGDGTLANFPDNVGGGSSVNYYLNGSVSQGTFGGDTYYEMNKTPILGAGTNFTRTNGQGNGYIASFITDAGDPSLLNIPAGNWNLEFYFQSSASGGSPQFYGEIYKVSSSNVFTLVASGSANPEGITNGTTVDQYFTSISVPQTSLLLTDRLAIRIYVVTGGRTITLHTENSNLCEVVTTFSTGLNALNGLTSQVQYLATGTSGTDFAISSATDTHTFNLPTASATNRGALSTTDWSTFNSKIGTGDTATMLTPYTRGSGTSGQVGYWNATRSLTGSSNLFWDNANGRLGIGTASPTNKLEVAGGFRLFTGGASANSHYVEAISSSSTLGYLNLVRNGGASGTYAYYLAGGLGYLSTDVGSGETRLWANNGGYYLTFFSNGLEALRIPTTRNVLIGTTTDAGYKLDVNGTARVQDNLTVSKTQDATTSISLLNSSTGTTASSRIYLGSTNTQIGKLSSGYTSGSILKSGDYFFYNQTEGNYTFWNNVSTGNINFTTGSGSSAQLTLASTGNLLLGTTTDVASSKLTVTSTTQGFLPPRMTTTQKNAISSPATGLMVYDTTLNKLCVFTGTVWETITSL